jgi:hypothetical protein
MYAIARQLQAPGVKTVATFNPTRLTNTLRNMTRKSIATGIHNGGWSSKAKDVRELVFKLAGEKPIVYVKQETNYMTLFIPRPITEDVKSEIIGLLEADCTLQKMNYDDSGERRYRPTRQDFNQTIDRRHLENLAKVKAAGNPDILGSHYIIVREHKLRQQIANTFLTQRTVEEIAIAERIARYLDDDLEYNVPTTYEF